MKTNLIRKFPPSTIYSNKINQTVLNKKISSNAFYSIDKFIETINTNGFKDTSILNKFRTLPKVQQNMVFNKLLPNKQIEFNNIMNIRAKSKNEKILDELKKNGWTPSVKQNIVTQKNQSNVTGIKKEINEFKKNIKLLEDQITSRLAFKKLSENILEWNCSSKDHQLVSDIIHIKKQKQLENLKIEVDHLIEARKKTSTDEELDCSEAIGKWQETYKTLTEKK